MNNKNRVRHTFIKENVNITKQLFLLSLIIFNVVIIFAQKRYDLNNNWFCKNINDVTEDGPELSSPALKLSNWLPATVPGTVLTTLLNNQLVPNPFFGMNNEKIPDIYFAGVDFYTYWFVCNFQETVTSGEEQVWLHLRGVNYACNIYLNGHKLNSAKHYGMFLRQAYNITSYLAADGNNRLAILVFPPNPAGNPNGGQGGDGTIARNVTHQYAAGWDWIQPVRDRNTGIWDKISIEKTLWADLKNPHIITNVPGKRFPGTKQEPAFVKSSVEIENPTDKPVKGVLQCHLEDKTVEKYVDIQPYTTSLVTLPDITIENPRLWWPSGYGDQNLYDFKLRFVGKNGSIFDKEDITIGIREIQTVWNQYTRSAQIEVNGQKIFLKGGNWIISDAMLRLSPERYDAEVHFHRDMNLNLIRIWGGALLERPEFYQACDKYGILVMQDFWVSGDCNGKWNDPMKKEDQLTRRKYPDDHQLFIKSIEDQVKMIRNHASLAFWCGGNEITPAEDILAAILDSLLSKLDGTRYFFPYSNSDEMSYNFIGGNGDGPYTIQDINTFWEHRTFPLNSEIGSVGTGDYESLERFIPEGNMIVPDYLNNTIDSVWVYHKDLGYSHHISLYGKPGNVKEFGEIAQLINYNQYRALAEGFSAKMWEWYTGFIIWKTQNPWTALRGQMYDYYLDPNACLYGLKCGSESVHIMCNPVDGMVMAVNNTFKTARDLYLDIKIYKINGEEIPLTTLMIEIGAGLPQKFFSVQHSISKYTKEQGAFLTLKLTDQNGELLSDNIYWYPDSNGYYTGLQSMPEAQVEINAKYLPDKEIEVTVTNPENGPIAFFNRISLVDTKTLKRVLPVFYSNNYISVLPGEAKTIIIDCSKASQAEEYKVSIRGWNLTEQWINITSN